MNDLKNRSKKLVDEGPGHVMAWVIKIVHYTIILVSIGVVISMCVGGELPKQ